MVYRVVLAFAFALQISAVAAKDLRTTIGQQVQDPAVCWDPDVEFPVPATTKMINRSACLLLITRMRYAVD